MVFHTAAHKLRVSSDGAKRRWKPKEVANVFGTLNVAELADKYNAESVITLISTDKATRKSH